MLVTNISNKLTRLNRLHDTSCARTQVVVSVNPKFTALPDTAVHFTSPTEAGSLFVESGMHFAGRLDFSAVTTRGIWSVLFLLMYMLSVGDLDGYDPQVHEVCTLTHALALAHEILLFVFFYRRKLTS